MDMMKGSTSFRALRDKYKDFSAPSVEITVGSEKLSEKKADIQEIEVELTSGLRSLRLRVLRGRSLSGEGYGL